MAKKNPKKKLLSKAEISRKYPDAGTANTFMPDSNTPWLPTRVLPYNYQLGGGTPYGRVQEIYGLESSGKSLLAYEKLRSTQYLGGVGLWADAEMCYQNSWAEKNGIDNSAVELLVDNTIENIGDWARDMILFHRSRLTKNEPILLVVDSLASTDVEAAHDADLSGGKAEMGNRAKAWDKLYRSLSKFFNQYGVIVVVINQVRLKIGASQFEDNQTTPGGKATAFYAAQRIKIVKAKQIRGYHDGNEFIEDAKKGVKVGNNVYIQIVKNKVAPPMDSLKTQVYFREDVTGEVGYNRYMGLDEIAISQGVITKSGNTYSMGGKKIGVGANSIMELIVDNSKFRSSLVKRLGINTLSKTQDFIHNIGFNKYPVK